MKKSEYEDKIERLEIKLVEQLLRMLGMQATIDKLKAENDTLRKGVYIVPRDWLEG